MNRAQQIKCCEMLRYEINWNSLSNMKFLLTPFLIIFLYLLVSFSFVRHHSTSLSIPFSNPSSNSLSSRLACFTSLSANSKYVVALLQTSFLTLCFRAHSLSHTHHISTYTSISTCTKTFISAVHVKPHPT